MSLYTSVASLGPRVGVWTILYFRMDQNTPLLYLAYRWAQCDIPFLSPVLYSELGEWLRCTGERGRSSEVNMDGDMVTNVSTIHGMGTAAQQHRGRGIAWTRPRRQMQAAARRHASPVRRD
jgi:hypothetical protein